MGPLRWKIDPTGPDPTQRQEIARALLRGDVLLLPTDTIYGLHALAHDERSVSRIFEIKGRTAEKALLVLFSSLDQLRDSGVVLSSTVAAFLAETWPAPLTTILELKKPIAATAGANTIAARVPALEWLRDMIGITGPLASTSANRTGEPPVQGPNELPPDLSSRINGIVDAGPLRSKSSTIVDFTLDPPKLVRHGEFFFTQNLWKKVWKSL